MTPPPGRSGPSRGGSRARGAVRGIPLALLTLLLPLPAPLAPLGATRARALQDQVPDTVQVVPDSADVVPDTLDVPPDTLVPPRGGLFPGDTIEVGGDTLDVAADSVPPEEEFIPRNLVPRLTSVPVSWRTGVWEWDREGLRSTRALTLLELLEQVPGVIPLRGGDYGQPATATAFGGGAGDIRVYLDGAELPPLDGGVVDLSRVGLANLERVRVERRGGELRVDLLPLVFDDPRPLSYLEVGTGDLNTNLFRGVFAHPDALGGTVNVALDRVDTGGRQRQETGVSFGTHLRYAIYPMERLGLALELRRMTSQRPPDIWDPEGVARTDWGLRASYEWAPWLRAGAFFQRSSLAVDTDDGGGIEPEPDTLINEDPRTQVGVRVSAERGPWWAEAEYGEHWGSGWASSRQSLRGGGTLPEIGGASAGIEREGWAGGESALSMYARAWSRPLFGVSLFGEVEDGTRGVPFWVPPDVPAEDDGAMDGGDGTEEPEATPMEPVSFTERTSFRAGLEYRQGELFAGVSAVAVQADSLHPVGLPTDRGGAVIAGGDRTGFEVSANLPLDRILTGLSARGSAQFWDRDATWRYLPDRSYQARIAFHDVYYESENLEVWVDIGVDGRDPMLVPVAVPGGAGSTEEVPFAQSWFGRLQIRVASVRVWVMWDNFTLRQQNQDYPGRLLPQTRAMYGIRWTMWN